MSLEAIQQPLTVLVAAVRTAHLKNANQNTQQNIFERGMVLTGGGALLRNIDIYFLKNLVSLLSSQKIH